MKGVRCDRFFLPEGRSKGVKTVELGREIAGYDVVGFSVPFELDYLNLVRQLKTGGIEPYAAKREAPLVVAGGMAVSANPEPIADFLDVIFVGEGDEVIMEFVECWRAARYAGATPAYAGAISPIKRGNLKETLLRNLGKISGVYVPSFYSVFYFSDGRVREIVPKKGAAKQVRRRAVATLKEAPHSPVVTSDSAFRDMFFS